MDKSHTFSTILYVDDEVAERDVVVYFTVPYHWANKWCIKNGYGSVDEFDVDYIWDNSYEMYMSAMEDNVIIRIENDESIVRTW